MIPVIHEDNEVYASLLSIDSPEVIELFEPYISLAPSNNLQRMFDESAVHEHEAGGRYFYLGSIYDKYPQLKSDSRWSPEPHILVPLFGHGTQLFVRHTIRFKVVSQITPSETCRFAGGLAWRTIEEYQLFADLLLK